MIFVIILACRILPIFGITEASSIISTSVII